MSYTVQQNGKNANQRTVVINRTLPKKDSGKPFFYVYEDIITQASRNLRGEIAFKLFLYLLANQDGYTLNYSPQHFQNQYGVSIDSARRALTTLIDAGYVEMIGDSRYAFYEYPKLAKPELIVGRRVVKLVNGKTGEIMSFTFPELVKLYDGNTVEAQNTWDYGVENNGGIFYE